MLTFKSYLELIEEGGAAGHMAHPFDLPFVRSGKNLITLFEKVKNSIKTTPAVVKIDGVNCSLKLVTNEDGSMEFGLDRGSKNPLDVKGITINDLSARFKEGHGFLEIGKTVLEIFNRALPIISDDLKKLGFYKNKNLIFNTEYVAGGTNVIGYADKFLAIHGVIESYEVKSPVRGSLSRRTREVNYDADVLNDLINRVNPIAKKYGFKVYSSIPATVESEINFTPALNTKVSIHCTPEHVVTKTLKAWLDNCGNPVGTPIKLIGGQTVDAVSKKLYLSIINGTPLTELIAEENKKLDNTAVCGAIIYHATRLLGAAVLNAMSSSIGDLNTQEGIVIRDPKISPTPFKITGEFIVGGMASAFRKEDDEELEGADKQDMDWQLANNYTGKVDTLNQYGREQGGALRVGPGELGGSYNEV
jgi:hypothetical protein